MQTRSEIHQGRRSRDSAEKQGTHLAFNIGGLVILVLLMVSLIASRTVLNKRFVIHEVTSSTVETDLLDQVQAGLNQYGIPQKALTKSDTDRIVRTVVNQAFADQELSLDLSQVTNRIAGQANSQLAQFGISTSLLPSGTTEAVNDNINSAVNSRINTPQVKQAINSLRLVRMVNTIILVISSVLLILMVVWAVLHHHLVQSFSWICILALVVSGGLVMIVRGIIPQLAAANPEYSSLAAQVTTDFQATALIWLGLLAVVTIALWVIRLLISQLLLRR